MYLIDTNVISEARKKDKADPGVRRFFEDRVADGLPLYLSVVTIGELRRGVEIIRHRSDESQARRLEAWLDRIPSDYRDCILPFESEAAQLWGRLCVPHPEHALDKQIAATALIHGLTVVTRNRADFAGIGVPVLNPFERDGA